MSKYRTSDDAVYDIKYHFVWVTKYRYQILKGDVALRLRELLKQRCEKRNIKILAGRIEPDYVHMFLSCPVNLTPEEIVQYLKEKSSSLLQNEFPRLKKKYWDRYIWGKGYFCRTAGEIEQGMILDYVGNQEKEEDDQFTIAEG